MEKVELPELKKCPHCNGPADLEFEDDEIRVECRCCGARGPDYERDISGTRSNMEAVARAIEGWNRRYTPKEAAIEEKKESIVDKIAECC